MSEISTPPSWSIHAGGVQYGPFTRPELQRLYSEERVDGDTEGYDPETDEWLPLREIEALNEIFGTQGVASSLAPPKFSKSGVAFSDKPDRVADSTQAVRYAGFRIRVAAYLIDTIVLFAVIAAVGLVLALVLPGGASEAELKARMAPFQLAACAINAAYFVMMQGGKRQATLGKQAVGIRLMRRDGGRVGYGLALGRYMALLLASLPFGIGLLMIGWTTQKRGLHDIICATRVVYGKT